ncbi:MAG: hypothetical protein U5R06_01495 [candidate division KSB1 bacterium]|nr:hypothetical protein [candidate division KSB1 bacterium]
MHVINFIIAVVALVFAILAYRRSGGDYADLKEQVGNLRTRTAEALEKAEKAIRPSHEEEEPPSKPSKKQTPNT